MRTTIHNKRYDIPDSFVKVHPGGRTLMELAANRNATELYESYHSLATKDVDAMLERWYVEDAKKGDPDWEDAFQWEHTPFWDTLVKRVRAHFGIVGHKRGPASAGKGTGRSHYKAPARKWAAVGASLAAFVVSMWCWFGGSVWACFAMPLFYWTGAAVLLHDGTHGALHASARVNWICGYVGSFHSDLTAWLHQHVLTHHVHTNRVHIDPDLHYFEGPNEDSIYGHRLHPLSPWNDRFMKWKKSLAITLPFSSLRPGFGDAIKFWRSGSLINRIRHTVRPGVPSRILHIGVRIALLLLLFVVPFFVLPYSSFLVRLLFVLVPQITYAALYYVFSQVSHVNAVCFPDDGSNDDLATSKTEWAAWQVRHACDWGPLKGFWHWLSVGLDAQTLHHLFPQVDPTHYAAMQHIIVDTTKEFGETYNHVPDLWTALGNHIGHIASMNEPAGEGKKAL